MYNKNIGFTIGKFAPLHKGHQLLIETALKEMDEVYVVVYDTDIIDINVEKRANWIKQLYPNIHIIYAYDSPKQYGLDKESVKIQMNYLSELIKDIPVTHFYSSELYGEKVAEYLNIENRMIDYEKKFDTNNIHSVELNLLDGQVEIILRALELYGYNLEYMLNGSNATDELRQEKIAMLKYTYEQVLATQAEQVDSKANNLDNLSSLGKLLSKNFGQIQPNKNLKVI